MKSLLPALVLSWFVPARSRQRAVPIPQVFRPRSAPRRDFRPADVIYVDDMPLVRPYLVAFERERERYLQRERRRAAALAAMGQDHIVPPGVAV